MVNFELVSKNLDKFSEIISTFGGIYSLEFVKSLSDKFEKHIAINFVIEKLSFIAGFISRVQEVINDNFTLLENKEKANEFKDYIEKTLLNSDDYLETLNNVERYIKSQTKNPQNSFLYPMAVVQPSRYELTLSEGIFDKAFVNEEVLSDDEKNEQVVHHPLWYVLDNISDEDSLNVDVKEDEKSSDVRSFNGKEVKIGDASNITFRNDNDVIGTKVSMTKADNNMTISHQKDKEVVNGSVKSSVLGLLDYMSESKQSPFVFNINTKTPEFKKTLVEELIALKNADMALKNEKEKSFVLKDKVDVFSFDGKVIPFSIFESFKDYEAFDNYVNGKGLKQKFEEVHNMVDSLSQKGRE